MYIHIYSFLLHIERKADAKASPFVYGLGCRSELDADAA